jgi:hypothetical protein
LQPRSALRVSECFCTDLTWHPTCPLGNCIELLAEFDHHRAVLHGAARPRASPANELLHKILLGCA